MRPQGTHKYGPQKNPCNRQETCLALGQLAVVTAARIIRGHGVTLTPQSLIAKRPNTPIKVWAAARRASMTSETCLASPSLPTLPPGGRTGAPRLSILASRLPHLPSGSRPRSPHGGEPIGSWGLTARKDEVLGVTSLGHGETFGSAMDFKLKSITASQRKMLHGLRCFGCIASRDAAI